MLNGFCRSGYPLSLNSSTEKVEQYIQTRAEYLLSENSKVIFVCDNHRPDDPEINNPYPPHCIQGTTEAEIIDSLRPLAKNAIILPKHTLSIFYQTGLDALLSSLNPSVVEIVGVCTDICDLFAVYELRIRGYQVFVSRKGVLPYDPKKQNEFLDYFKDKLGANVD
ncbi:MAG: cysteine hydrolase [Bacteroidetes bacterium]|nr:cysteine hydrolase [Bacteroidota bacterium]